MNTVSKGEILPGLAGARSITPGPPAHFHSLSVLDGAPTQVIGWDLSSCYFLQSFFTHFRYSLAHFSMDSPLFSPSFIHSTRVSPSFHFVSPLASYPHQEDKTKARYVTRHLKGTLMMTRPPAEGQRWFSMGLYQPIYLGILLVQVFLQVMSLVARTSHSYLALD